MPTILKTTVWTTVLMLISVAPAVAQHRHGGGSHVDAHDYYRSDLFNRSAYVDPHELFNRHVVTPFDSRYSGTYCEQNGHCYFRPTTSARMQEIRFGGFSHVDDLAARLEFLANELCLDLHYNYSHNRGFAVTYAEAYQVLDAARFIHSLEHNHQDRAAIQARLGGLDSLFHHVQDDVRGWSRHHRRQIGSLGIITKMDLMEATLHHLMNDVGVSATAGLEAAPAAGTGELAPPPGAMIRR